MDFQLFYFFISVTFSVTSECISILLNISFSDYKLLFQAKEFIQYFMKSINNTLKCVGTLASVYSAKTIVAILTITVIEGKEAKNTPKILTDIFHLQKFFDH
jgi:hypothetical protein